MVRWSYDAALKSLPEFAQIPYLAGIALYQAQSLEGYLRMLLCLRDAIEGAELSEEQVRSVIEGDNKETLGVLVKAVKNFVPSDTELFVKLSDGLQARNYLVHQLWMNHGRDMANPAERERMLAEIANLLQRISAASSMVDDVLYRARGEDPAAAAKAALAHYQRMNRPH